jgi:hypothetical protein
MKKSFIKLAGAFLLAFALGIVARATPITGNISFSGSAKLDRVPANLATQVINWGGNYTLNPVATVVSTDTGDFYIDAPPGTVATQSTAVWNFNTSIAIPDFWVAGGFSFELLESHVSSTDVGANSITVIGDGIVTGNYFDPTAGNWVFTTQGDTGGGPQGLKFSFSAYDHTTVPDGGTTALLLGAGLTGLALISRRQKRKS